MGCNKTGFGKLYSLQEAYNQGIITNLNLQTIAGKQPKDVTSIDKEIIKDVKTLYCNAVEKEVLQNGEKEFFNLNVNDIQKILFYGEYDGAYCFRVWNSKINYGETLRQETVEGVVFTLTGPNYFIWKYN